MSLPIFLCAGVTMKKFFVKVITAILQFVYTALGIEKHSKMQFAKHTEEKPPKSEPPD